jgi:hypothetical protein
MMASTPPALLAKIAAVEVWGRLFCRGECVDSVHERLAMRCEMVLPASKNASSRTVTEGQRVVNEIE